MSVEELDVLARALKEALRPFVLDHVENVPSDEQWARWADLVEEALEAEGFGIGEKWPDE